MNAKIHARCYAAVSMVLAAPESFPPSLRHQVVRRKRANGNLLILGGFAFALLGLILVVQSIPPAAKLPDCVKGQAPPYKKHMEWWDEIKPESQLTVAIDGSGSMLGLTGSPRAAATWKAMLQAVNLAAAASGTAVKPVRSGSGRLDPIANVTSAVDPCFFAGCGGFSAMTSSLGGLWNEPPVSKEVVPLKMAITDLEVNDGDVSSLVAAIKPHITKGAVIGILAVKIPFKGSVYNSASQVIHTGESERPIYLLTTGPRAQVHSLLNEIRTKAALGGVSTGSMQVTFLEDHVTKPTLVAESVESLPAAQFQGQVPVRIGGKTYRPQANGDYQFVRLTPQAKGIRLFSSPDGISKVRNAGDDGLVSLQDLSAGSGAVQPDGVNVIGIQMQGSELNINLSIDGNATPAAIRAVIPRGQLPEEWWLRWNRGDPASAEAKDQTDGLLLLLTSLSKLLLPTSSTPSPTPAAALCLAFSH